MKQQIIDELNRLYSVETRFNNLFNELERLITLEQGERPFEEIYNKHILKYLLSSPAERHCPASKAGICAPDERNPSVCMFCGRKL